MLKISDILKKAKKPEYSKEKTTKKITPASEQAPVPEAPARMREAVPEVSAQKPVDAGEFWQKEKNEISAAKQENAQQPPADEQEVIIVYKEAVSLAQKIATPFTVDKQGLVKEVESIVDKLINFLKRDGTQLERLFFSEYFIEQVYVYQHLVNVCVLSLRLGMALHYSHERLHQIGIAAFLHDIGLLKFEELISQPRRFNTAEYNEIKKHPVVGRDILKQFAQDLDLEIFDVIVQEHERIDASGYPYGLKEKEICDGAKIVGLVDEYEAMVHARPYRAKLGYLEAVKEIIRRKKSFEYKCLKALIDLAGIFPVNAMVKLNTREAGIVIKQNQQMPLRPVINITHNVHGKKLAEPKLVDLAANFSVYIQDCIIET